MSEKSLFAILLRSSWWVSIAVAACIAVVARMALPEQYMYGGMLAAIRSGNRNRHGLAAVAVAERRTRRGRDRRGRVDVVARIFGALENAFRRDGYETRRLAGNAVT